VNADVACFYRCVCQQVDDGLEPDQLVRCAADVRLKNRKIALGLRMHPIDEFDALVAMNQSLDGLFKPDGDQEADDDGRDVDEEVSPGVGGVVGWVDVEQGGGS
jgi:hypothetical protein